VLVDDKTPRAAVDRLILVDAEEYHALQVVAQAVRAETIVDETLGQLIEFEDWKLVVDELRRSICALDELS